MINLPRHDAGLRILHNNHINKFKDVEEYVSSDSDNWLSEKDKRICIEEDELWEVIWYPRNPINFNIVIGSSLEKVLNFIKKEYK